MYLSRGRQQAVYNRERVGGVQPPPHLGNLRSNGQNALRVVAF